MINKRKSSMRLCMSIVLGCCLMISFFGCRMPAVDSELDGITTDTTATDPSIAESDPLAAFASRPYYQLGTNLTLEDNVKVHLFFVDDNESSWDTQSIQNYTKSQIQVGLDYLEAQARTYGRNLKISTKSYATALNQGYTLKYEGVVLDGSTSGKSLDIMNHVARDLGYPSKEEMYPQLYQQNDCCTVIFLTIINKDGISFAYRQTGGNVYYASVEFGTIFTNYLGKNDAINDNTHMAATVAHEILHLFGAIDLYTPDDRKQYARKKYPQDIMLLDYVDIEKMNVGKFTAYSVGWANTQD